MVLLVVSDGCVRRLVDALASPEARDFVAVALEAGFVALRPDEAFLLVDEVLVDEPDDFDAFLAVDDARFFVVESAVLEGRLRAAEALDWLALRLEVDLPAAAGDRFDDADFALDGFAFDDVRDGRCAAMRTTLLVDESQDFIAVASRNNTCHSVPRPRRPLPTALSPTGSALVQTPSVRSLASSVHEHDAHSLRNEIRRPSP